MFCDEPLSELENVVPAKDKPVPAEYVVLVSVAAIVRVPAASSYVLVMLEPATINPFT